MLNANYLKANSAPASAYPSPFERHCMHEFVPFGKPMKKELGLAALDLAKRLLDFGFPPTDRLLPLLVEEA